MSAVQYQSELQWMAQTKFLPPQLREDVVERPRLTTALYNAVTSRVLTLVSAPAGAGKTTLLASLPQQLPALPLAWLSLDYDDNDPVRFLMALIGAVLKVNPTCGLNARQLLGGIAATEQDLRRVIGVLINEIVEKIPDSFVLVLDDLHVVRESSIYVALEYLLERMPSQMRLVIATRYDPPLNLARLRARRMVAELRIADLRFTTEEAEYFLNDCLQMNLTPEQVELLEYRTEGWAAGLSLLVSSLEESRDRDMMITYLSSTDRYVFDFLADEVLNKLDLGLRDFVLRTSILHELNPVLCRAVTGNQLADEMLEQLYRRNLFVVSVNPQTRTYRYHDLFKDFLRQQLVREMPEQIQHLHAQVARAEKSLPRAISHYLSAELFDEAALRLEEAAPQLLQMGMMDALKAWIMELPESTLDEHPGLVLSYGLSCWLKWDYACANKHFQKALKLYELSDDTYGQGEALAYLSAISRNSMQFEQATDYTTRALELPVSPRTRMMLLSENVFMLTLQQRPFEALEVFDQILDLADENPDLNVLMIIATEQAATLSVIPGALTRIRRLSDILAGIAGEESPAAAVVHALRSICHAWAGEWGKGPNEGRIAVEINSKFGNLFRISGMVGAGLANFFAINERYTEAHLSLNQVIEHLESNVKVEFFEHWRSGYLYYRARVNWMEGNLEGVRQVIKNLEERTAAHIWPHTRYVTFMLKGILSLETHDYTRAEELLNQAHQVYEQYPFVGIFGCARIMLANLYLQTRKHDEAERVLQMVLNENRQNGTPGIVMWEGYRILGPLLKFALERNIQVEFVRDLMQRLNISADTFEIRPQGAVLPDGAEKLTPREVEILQLLANGYSNQDVADTLVISLHTVKHHVASVLQKLLVSSRTQAVARARELKLV